MSVNSSSMAEIREREWGRERGRGREIQFAANFLELGTKLTTWQFERQGFIYLFIYFIIYALNLRNKNVIYKWLPSHLWQIVDTSL